MVDGHLHRQLPVSQSLSIEPTYQSDVPTQQQTDTIIQATTEAIPKLSQLAEVETIPELTQPTTFSHQPTEQADVLLA